MADNSNDLEVTFLGIAERAGITREGDTPFTKWTLIGIRSALLVPVFPFPLTSSTLVFAARNINVDSPLELRIRDEGGKECAWIRVDAKSVDAPQNASIRSDPVYLLTAPRGWVLMPITLSQSPIMIETPGLYSVTMRSPDHSDQTVGQFRILATDVGPFTSEQVAAIRSDPRAAKAVHVVLGCQHCLAKLRVYAALERIPKLESEGHIWYQHVSDHFRCECGSTALDLSSIRRNLFAYIGQRMRGDGEGISLIPQYEASAIETICKEFVRLLDRNVPEEELQKFIERYTILLHQFPADRIFFKPAILTKYNADFAILTPQKEIVVIEIERAGTRLLKKDGGQAAELRHAFDQVHSWLHLIDDHRSAVLDMLGIPRDLVSKVRGVVIAGRDRGNDAAHLRLLKGIDHGNISLLTFDDLASGLATLSKQLADL